MAIGTVILLPGLDGTGDLFAPFVDVAPQGVNAVVVEYPVSESSIGVLESLARSELVESCVVIAESFSGPIGVRLAHDERVRALVLCNSFYKSPHSSSLRHLAVAPLFAVPIPGVLLRWALLGGDATPGLLASVRRSIGRVSADVLARRFREVCLMDETAAVQTLAKPIFYLRGGDDRVLSDRSWMRLKALRPDARIATIDGPHLLLQTRPKECWDAISRFVE